MHKALKKNFRHRGRQAGHLVILHLGMTLKERLKDAVTYSVLSFVRASPFLL